MWLDMRTKNYLVFKTFILNRIITDDIFPPFVLYCKTEG